MKKILSLVLIVPQFYFAQCNLDAAKSVQQELINKYNNENTSPLKGDLFLDFKGLQFFSLDPNYCVEATFKRTENEKPFKMKTTGKGKPTYVKYGELYFTINGKYLKLDTFQNLDLINNNPKYKNHLFLPFTDLTSGVSSYGGGRYLELEIPKNNKITIDFNKAYNPYCAYSPGYSCPIVPEQNDLDVEILAGVKYNN